MAWRVQPGTASQLAGLSSTGTRGGRVVPRSHSNRTANYERFTNIAGGTNNGGGSLNPVLEAVGLWRFLERLVFVVLRLRRRPDLSVPSADRQAT